MSEEGQSKAAAIGGHRMPERLADLAPDSWFTQREQSTFWLRLYTLLFLPREKAADALTELMAGIDRTKPFVYMGRSILFMAGVFQGLKVPYFTRQMYSQESGQTRIDVKVEETELPDTLYVALATPCRIDGAPGREGDAKAALAEAAGLLCTHVGHNFLRDLVFDGEVNASDGKFSHPGEPWRMPARAEGPFINRQNAIDVQEIAQAVTQLTEPTRSRLVLTLQLVDEAMRRMLGFFEYWTALEVLCEGRSHRIKARLSRLYGIRNHKGAANLTGFSTLERWRHDYIHRGQRPPMTADIERYMQLLFLDLLRQELHLPPRWHMAGMQQATGYDLSAIGLADNRTDEQKRAVDEMRARSTEGSDAPAGT